MATTKNRRTKTTPTVSINRTFLQTILFGFVMGLIGFVAALAIAMPAAQQQVANAQPLQVTLAAAHETSCAVSPAAKPAPANKGGKGGFVSQLVTGMLTKNVGTITNTGPNSDNKVIFKTETITHVTNTNTIDMNFSNGQTASSGDANVSDNTTAGGADTGWTNTSNQPDMTVNISN